MCVILSLSLSLTHTYTYTLYVLFVTPQRGRHEFVSAGIGDEVLIWGGRSASGSHVDTALWAFSVSKKKWHMIHNGKVDIFSKVQKWHVIGTYFKKGTHYFARYTLPYRYESCAYLAVVNHVPFLADDSQRQGQHFLKSKNMAHDSQR